MSLRRRLVLPALCLALSFATASGAYGAEPSPAPLPSAPQPPVAAECSGVFPPFEPESVPDVLAYSLDSGPMLRLLESVVRLDAAGQRTLLAATAAPRSGALAAAVDRAVRAACIGPQVRHAVARFAILASATWDEARVNSPAFEAFAEGPLAVALGATAASPALPAETLGDALNGFPPPVSPATLEPSSCEQPSSFVRVLHARTPPYPVRARMTGTSGQVIVRVNLDPAGLVRNLLVYSTEFPSGTQEGKDSLIEAALSAAALTTFAPAYEGCRAVTGSYLFRVDFNVH